MPTSDVEDDLRWLELLAGRSAPEALPQTRNEAAWLRAAMLTYKPARPAGVPPEPAQRIDDLMRRAIAAGLFTERDLSAALGRPQGAPATGASGEPVLPKRGLIGRLADQLGGWFGTPGQPMRWAAMAASVVAASWVLWSLQSPTISEEAALRGGTPVQQIATVSVVEDQQRVLDQLTQAGFEAIPFERLGRRGIDVQMPERPSARQLDVLKTLRLQRPSGPQLVIEFV